MRIVNHGAVQAHNVPWAAIPSMGESWHNNHHAFPASALHGLYPGQFDIGFHFVRLLERAGLASDIQTATSLPSRACISCIDERARPAVTKTASYNLFFGSSAGTQVGSATAVAVASEPYVAASAEKPPADELLGAG